VGGKKIYIRRRWAKEAVLFNWQLAKPEKWSLEQLCVYVLDAE